MLAGKIFRSRIQSDTVTKKEKVLGYFFGPISVSVMGSILANYLNVYYTDVIDIASIWGGAFLSLFPLICKMIDSLTFVLMGRVVDRTASPQGKARPWILLSTPVLLISMVLLFAVPNGSDWFRAVWIFFSYNLFYSIGYTAYSTCHTLLIPLSTKDKEERGKLSLISNALNMLSGFFLAVLFPCVLVPAMGVNRRSWLVTILVITVICCPLLLLEYYYTVERVTKAEGEKKESLSLKEQFLCCIKSRQWIILMIYMVVLQFCGALSSYSTFYYCNWVLGSYNDGITQALFYGLGNAPLSLGVFLCMPLCRRFGRRNAMMSGYVLAAIGSALCLFNSRSLATVLAGQAVKAVGLIPSTFMVSTLLADALDDVEGKSRKRCDGFSSSVFNIIITLSGGAALGIFNFFLTRLGYLAPSTNAIPVQSASMQGFFSFCSLGVPALGYLLLAGLLWYSALSGKPRQAVKKLHV